METREHSAPPRECSILSIKQFGSSVALHSRAVSRRSRPPPGGPNGPPHSGRPFTGLGGRSKAKASARIGASASGKCFHSHALADVALCARAKRSRQSPAAPDAALQTRGGHLSRARLLPRRTPPPNQMRAPDKPHSLVLNMALQ